MRHIGDWIIYVGGVAGALISIGVVLRALILRAERRARVWVAREIGAPLRETREQTATIAGEVSHNHGTSMKDAVTRTEVAVQTLTARFDDHLRTHHER